LLDVQTYTHIENFMGLKRTREQAMGEGKNEKGEQPASPYMSMFETFRTELDEHHARRERCIKASRDITAASKKMYVSKEQY
jgi:hypothetical protein